MEERKVGFEGGREGERGKGGEGRETVVGKGEEGEHEKRERGRESGNGGV